jgi:general stress protein 26
MEEKEIKQECLKLMQTADAIYLSTLSSDGYPHTRMMSNLRNKKENPGLVEMFKQYQESFVVHFITSKSSAKMQHIKSHPKVSAYLCNPGEFHTLMLGGEPEEITDMEFKKQIWQDSWKIHWPGGAADPEFTVLKLSPAFARGWYKEGPFEFKLK